MKIGFLITEVSVDFVALLCLEMNLSGYPFFSNETLVSSSTAVSASSVHNFLAL
jgi:hypothetical protein